MYKENTKNSRRKGFLSITPYVLSASLLVSGCKTLEGLAQDLDFRKSQTQTEYVTKTQTQYVKKAEKPVVEIDDLSQVEWVYTDKKGNESRMSFRNYYLPTIKGPMSDLPSEVYLSGHPIEDDVEIAGSDFNEDRVLSKGEINAHVLNILGRAHMHPDIWKELSKYSVNYKKRNISGGVEFSQRNDREIRRILKQHENADFGLYTQNITSRLLTSTEAPVQTAQPKYEPKIAEPQPQVQKPVELMPKKTEPQPVEQKKSEPKPSILDSILEIFTKIPITQTFIPRQEPGGGGDAGAGAGSGGGAAGGAAGGGSSGGASGGGGSSGGSGTGGQ